VAEQHYLQAIAQGRAAGVTFLAAMATLGLLSVQATTGRAREALAGYRDVIDYFTRTNNSRHLRIALRNLARLLHQLGDSQPAAQILATVSPDAPPGHPGPAGAATPTDPPTQAEVLDVARAAIARNLTSP
jgi:hypothetical protein